MIRAADASCPAPERGGAHRFDGRYRETALLRDGSRVVLRLVRPDDKALLRRGFERLSPESRYRRFMSAKSQLTDAELAYLTEVDGWSHFALGAVVEGAGGGAEGVGIRALHPLGRRPARRRGRRRRRR